MTFGLRRPVVLLPDDLRAHAPAVQQAVLCHELFHVQRRDWLWLAAEELVRAALWFHPAIWWLVSRIQLAREEAVDELTVLTTHGRRAYIEALMAFAGGRPQAAAAAFSHRSHLFRRIVLVSQEAVMSARRVVASCAVMALAVGGGGWFVTGVFPLVQTVAAQQGQMVVTQQADDRGWAIQDQRTTDPGPLERAAKAITPENPVPRRVFSTPAYYPPDGLASNARATVSLRVTVDRSGNVGEIRQLRVNVSAAGTFSESLGTLNEAFLRAAVEAVSRWQYDPPVEAPIAFDVTVTFSPDAAEASSVQGQGPAGRGGVANGPAAGVMPTFSTAPVRIGGNIGAPTKLRHVSPVYPQIAQQARVSGVVILEAVIGPDGRVVHGRVLRSVPLLDQAAIDAVMQWEFTPTLLNGNAVPVIMTVTVAFTLD